MLRATKPWQVRDPRVSAGDNDTFLGACQSQLCAAACPTHASQRHTAVAAAAALASPPTHTLTDARTHTTPDLMEAYFERSDADKAPDARPHLAYQVGWWAAL
jgi:hypothetical protein